MQSDTLGFSGRSGETISSEAAAGSWMRTVLSGAGRDDRYRRIAAGLGVARTPLRQDRYYSSFGQKSADRDRFSLRDEFALGELAACRDPRGTSEHYRFLEVEKPDGRIQSGQAPRRDRCNRGRAECVS